MILAIEDGGDWNNASVEYLSVPECFNCDEARKLYSEFICALPEDQAVRVTRWRSFRSWLLREGLATVPENKDLIIDDS